MTVRLHRIFRLGLVAVLLPISTLSLVSHSALGAPVGSPVSVARTITMAGSGVSGLHFKDGVIWTTLYGSSRVERINATTGALIGLPISTGANPVTPIEVNGHLFVPSSGSNTVIDINMSTATVTRTITLGNTNISALVYDGTNIWAVSFNGATVQRFNPSTGALVGSAIPVGSQPGMAVAADGFMFVPASGSNTVTAIDMSTATVAYTVTLSGSNIASLTHDGSILWASIFNDAKVARINPADGAILGYTSTGSNPTNILSANGSIWVGSTGTDLVTQINPSTGAVIRNINQGGGNISSLNYDGEVIWATNFNSNFISMINTTTGQVSATKPTVGAQPVVSLIVDNNVWVGAANSNTVIQISGPIPTTTTTTTTTTTVAPTSTLSPTTTSLAPVMASVPSSTVADSPTRSASNDVVQQADSSPTVRNQTSVSTSSTTTTTTSIPKVADVEAGSAAILVNGTETKATVVRSDNQLVVTASGIELKLWGSTKDGDITSLDADGQLRVTESDRIEMEVSGVKASVAIEVWMFSIPTKLGSLTANTSGKAAGQFSIPSGIEAGKHRFAIESRLPNNEKATVAVGIVFGKAKTTSTTTRVFIAMPILLAIAIGLIVPTTVRRRRRLAAT